MSVIFIFEVTCGREIPRTMGFYTVFIRFCVCDCVCVCVFFFFRSAFCHQSYEFEYYVSLHIIFFPNVAETVSVGHLGPHWGEGGGGGGGGRGS